jgi:hypothetical protein
MTLTAFVPTGYPYVVDAGQSAALPVQAFGSDSFVLFNQTLMYPLVPALIRIWIHIH